MEFPPKHNEFFLKNLHILRKLKEFSKKTQGFEKKLGVLEAMCLRLPPKNWAKKGPGLKRRAKVVVTWASSKTEVLQLPTAGIHTKNVKTLWCPKVWKNKLACRLSFNAESSKLIHLLPVSEHPRRTLAHCWINRLKEKSFDLSLDRSVPAVERLW